MVVDRVAQILFGEVLLVAGNMVHSVAVVTGEASPANARFVVALVTLSWPVSSDMQMLSLLKHMLHIQIAWILLFFF